MTIRVKIFPPLKSRYGLRYETSLSLKHRLWLELVGLSAADQEKTGPNERETDGYTRGDLRFGIDVGEALSFFAALENFTDELYHDHLSSTWQEYGLCDQPGRNFKLMVKGRF